MQEIHRTTLIAIAVAVASSLVLAGCSSDDDDDDSGVNVSAPTSAAGDTYAATIESGSGIFASTGTFTISFSDTDDSYTLDGDDANVVDSAGTFAYSATGADATLTLEDSAAGAVTYELEFTTETSGRFTGSADSDPDSSQAGTFVRE